MQQLYFVICLLTDGRMPMYSNEFEKSGVDLMSAKSRAAAEQSIRLCVSLFMNFSLIRSMHR